MADMHTPLMIRQIGEIEFETATGKETVTGVLLQGDVEAVREAAQLFGQPVRLVSVAPSQDAETVKALREALEDCERAASGLTPNNAVSYIRGRAAAALAGSAS